VKLTRQLAHNVLARLSGHVKLIVELLNILLSKGAKLDREHRGEHSTDVVAVVIVVALQALEVLRIHLNNVVIRASSYSGGRRASNVINIYERVRRVSLFVSGPALVTRTIN